MDFSSIFLISILILIVGMGMKNKGLTSLGGTLLVLSTLPVLLPIVAVFVVAFMIYYKIILKSKINNFENTHSKFYYYKSNFNSSNFRNDFFKSGMNIENKSKYYLILGVTEEASQEEIKKAYKTLAKKYHPDVHHGKSEEEIKKNENKFRQVTEAYEKLKEE